MEQNVFKKSSEICSDMVVNDVNFDRIIVIYKWYRPIWFILFISVLMIIINECERGKYDEGEILIIGLPVQ